jgi:hypothetical protein
MPRIDMRDTAMVGLKPCTPVPSTRYSPVALSNVHVGRSSWLGVTPGWDRSPVRPLPHRYSVAVSHGVLMAAPEAS